MMADIIILIFTTNGWFAFYLFSMKVRFVNDAEFVKSEEHWKGLERHIYSSLHKALRTP